MSASMIKPNGCQNEIMAHIRVSFYLLFCAKSELFWCKSQLFLSPQSENYYNHISHPIFTTVFYTMSIVNTTSVKMKLCISTTLGCSIQKTSSE